MKMIEKVRDKLSGLIEAVSRYPLTVLFLLAAAVTVSMTIRQEVDYYKYFLTFFVGAGLSFTSQALWERFFDRPAARWALMALCLFLALGYFLIVKPGTWETWIRTAIALFALCMAFIWVPTIKNSITFNESFMAAFKALFNALLFSGVLFFGITIILRATDALIFRVSEQALMHCANVIFIIFAPLYLLSLIPVYPGASDKNRSKEQLEANREMIVKTSNCPRFLEILISYIIIPLLTVFTLILVFYIVRNITGRFWTDNLLEPMLVGFAITVILVYILASRLDNKFAALFRKIFPKVLVPIVLFQIVSSVLRIGDAGITHGRYFVILFGIYAAVSGVLLSFLPVRKNGIIAALLIVFAFISIMPPVDAYSISRTSQIKTLTRTLQNNGMLQDNKLIPKGSIPEEDQKIISYTVSYLGSLGYTKDIPWLGKDFDVYNDFYITFGFNRFEEARFGEASLNLFLNPQAPIPIAGYDILVRTEFYYDPYSETTEDKLCDFEKAGSAYSLHRALQPSPGSIWLEDALGREMIRIDMKAVYDAFYDAAAGGQGVRKDSADPGQMTFSQENEQVLMTLVANNVMIDKADPDMPYSGDFYVLVMIK
jgi:hypothetical protein